MKSEKQKLNSIDINNIDIDKVLGNILPVGGQLTLMMDKFNSEETTSVKDIKDFIALAAKLNFNNAETQLTQVIKTEGNKLSAAKLAGIIGIVTGVQEMGTAATKCLAAIFAIPLTMGISLGFAVSYFSDFKSGYERCCAGRDMCKGIPPKDPTKLNFGEWYVNDLKGKLEDMAKAMTKAKDTVSTAVAAVDEVVDTIGETRARIGIDLALRTANLLDLAGKAGNFAAEQLGNAIKDTAEKVKSNIFDSIQTFFSVVASKPAAAPIVSQNNVKPLTMKN